MSILTSPFLSLTLLDTALRAATGEERVRLLAAKVAFLQAEAASGCAGPGATGRSGPSAGTGRSGSARAAGGETAVPSAPARASMSASASGSSTASISAPAPAPVQARTPAPAPAPRRTPSPHIPLLTARLELAHAYAPQEPHAAAAEAMAVEGECRRLVKWVERGRAGRRPGGSGGVGVGGGGVGGADEGGGEGGSGESLVNEHKTEDERGGGVQACVHASQTGVHEDEDGARDDTPVTAETARNGAGDDAGDQTRATTTTPATAPAPPPWLAEITRLRAEALALLVRVEEGLGRPARAERWRRMV